MDAHAPRPLIGIPADRKLIGASPFHAVGEKYLTAVHDAAGGLPLPLPALGDALDLDEMLELLDGVLLTGSRSNVEPRHYSGTPSDPGTAHDPHRDATTLPLIPKAIAMGVPLLAICRGFQEMNVALGGSLLQKVHEHPGMLDHRQDEDLPNDARYLPAHEIRLTSGGLLARLAGGGTVRVNSLHTQGVDRLAPGLTVEAAAPDGLIEAFRVADAPGFTLAVQWHPEWRVMDNPLSRAIFLAFGEACRSRGSERGRRAYI